MTLSTVSGTVQTFHPIPLATIDSEPPELRLRVVPPTRDFSETLPQVSVILPVFNEAANIGDCLARCDSAFANLPWKVELVLVDDGSTDSSLQRAEETVVTHCSVRCLKLTKHSGKTPAIRAGINAAQGQYIVLMDSDLQYDARDVPSLLDLLNQGWGGVNGWRVDRKDDWKKKLPSKAYNWALRTAFGLHVQDADSGLKAFRAEALQKVSLEGDAHRLLLPMVQSAGYTIAEVPIRHYPRIRGRSKYGALRLITGSIGLLGLKVIHIFGWNPRGLSVRGWNFFHHTVWAAIAHDRRAVGNFAPVNPAATSLVNGRL